MAMITLGGEPVQTAGEIPQPGDVAPEFKLTNTEMKDRHLSDYEGKKVVMNIFPSIDTDVSATSVRKFNEKAADMDNVIVLNISKDLPFAHKRFCAAEDIEDIETLSEFKDQNFSREYHVAMTEGPLDGLMSRAVIVIDENGSVIYSEQVADIDHDPNYDKALEVLR